MTATTEQQPRTPLQRTRDGIKEKRQRLAQAREQITTLQETLKVWQKQRVEQMVTEGLDIEGFEKLKFHFEKLDTDIIWYTANLADCLNEEGELDRSKVSTEVIRALSELDIQPSLAYPTRLNEQGLIHGYHELQGIPDDYVASIRAKGRDVKAGFADHIAGREMKPRSAPYGIPPEGIEDVERYVKGENK